MKKTVSIRKKLGFPTKAQFLKEHAIYTRESLDIAGHEIMQRWETNYMKKLASIACANGGKVLELGFGMGISAHFIQKYKYSQSTPKIKSHVVIEAHPEVCKYARKMFSKEIKVGQLKLLQGYWQDVTKELKKESFDGILFDTYPLTEKEIHKNHFYFFKEAYRLLKKGGVLTYYSDESKRFSKEHLQKLREAGFKNIEWESCKVNPPKESMYWRRKTILAPKIIK
ncbi:MAG: methyltransferase [Nanoarchaeota archaeon]|nr:methyltransferase [Nanoarchaeota archaeon]